jgi:hypothetical protein
MKSLMLCILFCCTAVFANAQTVSTLSPGKYQTKTKTAQGKWDKGDVILLDDSHYKLSGSNDVGEYRFSVAAQRIFFTSGPLKSAFTKVTLNNNKTVIIFPLEQNQALGLPAEVWASQ